MSKLGFFFRRHFWMIQISAVLASSYIAANLAADAVELRLLRAKLAATSCAAPGPAAAPTPHARLSPDGHSVVLTDALCAGCVTTVVLDVPPTPHDVVVAPPAFAMATDESRKAEELIEHGGLIQMDATHWKITRATIDALLACPMCMARGARVVPAVRDGHPDGFKLYAIQPGSLYDRLGLENGDTLLTINGFELASPDKALETYTKLRSSELFDVELRRDGQLRHHYYAIVP